MRSTTSTSACARSVRPPARCTASTTSGNRATPAQTTQARLVRQAKIGSVRGRVEVRMEEEGGADVEGEGADAARRVYIKYWAAAARKPAAYAQTAIHPQARCGNRVDVRAVTRANAAEIAYRKSSVKK